jgi:hypothetical protein
MELSDLQHRPTCDPRERTSRSCPCGVLDDFIAEACARLTAMLEARRADA